MKKQSKTKIAHVIFAIAMGTFITFLVAGLHSYFNSGDFFFVYSHLTALNIGLFMFIFVSVDVVLTTLSYLTLKSIFFSP